MKKHPKLMSLLLFIGLFIFVIVPFVPLILSSLSFGWRWPEVFPQVWSLRAWEYVVNDGRTWQAVGISLWIALIVTAVNILLAVPAANALARYPVRGRWLFETIIFAPIIIPPFISVMGIHLTFLRLGLTETVLGVVLAHIAPTLPYMFRAVMISYQTLSADWEDQARMLGAGAMPRFFHVVLPHLLPGIMAGASLSVLISLSQYLITFIIGAGQVVTLPILLFPFISGGDPAVASAYSLLYAAIAIAALVGMDAALKRYYQMNKASQDQARGVKP
ncbi:MULTISPECIES: ABC transporter permease [unclassified Planococcus (in: firmicutes)]|uniref:ABC transporter permease n=1 Tax=unclassified Planococcus (in: firmicutes) TaxID=2662419 RepID=UPI000C345CFC|nr:MULTISPECIES: ABC transporter permease subunit [unclassified Planococcus (in: firmicutes)]AUD13867.1 ABC transporter permease [Planococcus sp. MB-3u-03]PKG45624.1 ABC transporter permease [Planococcus sp. Urea-trap-24]PKG88667.1 ABC transporter permease [Planococcus sp. Urea-3u-39]PKH38615.1 ABC transporter permease [Planococcus sp. MB-3u-09]